jgi:two-component system cell cycle response regulator
MSEVLKSKVLLVDDEDANLRALERTLRGQFDITACLSPLQALEKLKTEDFAAVVSDQRMPDMMGTEFLSKVAQVRPFTTRLILTAFTESRDILDAINRAEIYRYITKPWDNAELLTTLKQACERSDLRRENDRLVGELRNANATLELQVTQRTAELSQANIKLNELAMTDPLTRVANRRALAQRFQEEIDRGERYGRPITVAMLDVDHFKSFNDMEGHVCGDEALKKIAAIMGSNLRKTDFLGRYGGEEFLIIMPETPISVGLETITRLRVSVENTLFQGKQKSAYLTVSMGISAFPQHGRTPKMLTEVADQAMYEAKQSGRNRIVVAS